MKHSTVAALALAAAFGNKFDYWQPKDRERTPEESARRIAAAQAKRERKAAKRRAQVQP